MSQWNEWRPGDHAPLSPFHPIEIKWHNGLTRVYEFGQYIAWKNLTRPLQWRDPTPPKPEMPKAVWLYQRPEDGSLFARNAANDSEPRGGVLYVRQS